MINMLLVLKDIPVSYLEKKRKMCEDRAVTYSKKAVVNRVIVIKKERLIDG